MNEEQAGASYILQFFSEVMNMNSYYSNYKRYVQYNQQQVNQNTLETNEGALDEETINTLNTVTQNLNYTIDQTYIMSQALSTKVKSFSNPEIKKLYEETNTQALPERLTIEKYVILINKAFVDDVVQKLLINSKEIYTKLTQNQQK